MTLRIVRADARLDEVAEIDGKWAVSYPFEIGVYLVGFETKDDADIVAKMLEIEREGTKLMCSED